MGELINKLAEFVEQFDRSLKYDDIWPPFVTDDDIGLFVIVFVPDILVVAIEAEGTDVDGFIRFIIELDDVKDDDN